MMTTNVNMMAAHHDMIRAAEKDQEPDLKTYIGIAQQLQNSELNRTQSSKVTGEAPNPQLLDKLRLSASDLAQLAVTTHGWRFLNEKNNTMVYELASAQFLPTTVSTVGEFGRTAGKRENYYLVRGVTTVHTSPEEFLRLLDTRVTEEFHTRMDQIFGTNYLRGVTLNRLTCTTPRSCNTDEYDEDDAYSANWMVLAPFSAGATPKDTTFASYQDAFYRDETQLRRVGRSELRNRPQSSSNANTNNGTGRYIGVHTLTSVLFRDMPEHDRKVNLDRIHFRDSGFVIEETQDPNACRVSLYISLLPTKSMIKNTKKYQKWVQQLVTVVGNIGQLLKPEMSLSFVPRSKWRNADHCAMCLKIFRAFRRKHHCRFCGETVCHACSGFVNLEGYEVVSTGETMVLSNASSIRYRESGASESRSVSSEEYEDLSHTRGCSLCVQEVLFDMAQGGSSQSGSITTSNYERKQTSHLGSFDLELSNNSMPEPELTAERRTSNLSGFSIKQKSLGQTPNENSISTAASSYSRTSHDDNRPLFARGNSRSNHSLLRDAQPQREPENYSDSDSDDMESRSFAGDLLMDPDVNGFHALNLGKSEQDSMKKTGARDGSFHFSLMNAVGEEPVEKVEAKPTPLASLEEDKTPKNDMIPLNIGSTKQEFVVFSDSRRSSIVMRPEDGRDMIPLDLSGNY